MTIEEMIDEIDRVSCIYNIHFCNAGVGILFFEPPEGYQMNAKTNEAEWMEHLVVHKYYPTIRDCVESEYKRLCTDEVTE